MSAHDVTAAKLEFRAALQHRTLFIDGNVECYKTSWRILIGVVVILCFVPIAFAGALLRNKLSEQARCAVCRAYTERLFYRGAAL